MVQSSVDRCIGVAGYKALMLKWIGRKSCQDTGLVFGLLTSKHLYTQGEGLAK